MGLFVWSNTTRGAAVYMNFSLFGFISPSQNLKEFKLADSVSDMWKAGVYPLSLLIAVFSGAWPYIKLILVMIVWTIEERRLTFRMREKILIVLDTMGKWSLIDCYVMVLMLVAFYFNIQMQ